MKHEVSIHNGSGWNNYAALRELKTLPRGVKGLMAEEGVAEIIIGPADPDKPLGMSAEYRDAEGETIFTQYFGQNDSAAWIRDRVMALLEQGIQNRIAERRKEVAAERLAAAKAAGFETAEAHAAHAESERARMAAEREAERRRILNDTANAQRAEQEMRSLRAAHPAAVRMTRKLDLLDANEQRVAIFTNKDGMRAWLHQRGHRPNVDDRMKFFNC